MPREEPSHQKLGRAAESGNKDHPPPYRRADAWWAPEFKPDSNSDGDAAKRMGTGASLEQAAGTELWPGLMKRRLSLGQDGRLRGTRWDAPEPLRRVAVSRKPKVFPGRFTGSGPRATRPSISDDRSRLLTRPRRDLRCASLPSPETAKLPGIRRDMVRLIEATLASRIQNQARRSSRGCLNHYVFTGLETIELISSGTGDSGAQALPFRPGTPPGLAGALPSGDLFRAGSSGW